ncbi:hypothetical protein KL86CLO1_11532 [uncultured Eubacteriales bacterium]|uniref:Uncharacterized protein n=1 Tax=uncultured Eubacteriales bacterium TaxID=172733 RepID=A0A212JQH8_9FIRM|nr:hypothetical protein KL86CLO1_11532 [uncultured Eubacteriales bacterium]
MGKAGGTKANAVRLLHTRIGAVFVSLARIKSQGLDQFSFIYFLSGNPSRKVVIFSTIFTVGFAIPCSILRR